MKNKIALVTGGTSGIGLEIVKQLLAENRNVITCYRTHKLSEKNKTLFKKLGGSLMEVKADISEEKQVKQLFKIIKDKFGKLDYLVNNAGTNIDSFIKDFDLSDFQDVIKTNLIGKFLCTKHSIPLLKKGGAIVNVSSNLGVVACAESSAYNAAAAAIINFTKSSVLELSGYGIRINCVSPGFTPTPLSLSGWTKEEIKLKEKTNPLKRLATTTDIANTVLFLLSDKASFINGQNIMVNGGSVMI